MVTTPKVWKSLHEIQASSAGSDGQLALTDIGDGNYVAVWTRDSANLFARIFDAQGKPVGPEFQIGHGDLEGSPAVVARPGGGFIVAYTSLAGGGNSVHTDIYDGQGGFVETNEIQPDDNGALDPHSQFYQPSIAVRPNGSYLVTYLRQDASGDAFNVEARKVNAHGVVKDEHLIFVTADTTDGSPPHAEVAALSNGNYVVAYDNGASSDSDPQFKIVGADGVPPNDGTQPGFQISLSVNDQTDIQVAALKGGGFAVAWVTSNDGDGAGIRYSVYDNNANAVKANPFNTLPDGFAVNTTTAGHQISPDVTALRDGGFVATWDDIQRGGVYAQRFDAAGNMVGHEFHVGDYETTTSYNPAIAGLGDGRFVAGFGTTGPGYDQFAAIFDPRGKVINGTSDDDVLTSRKQGGTVNGKAGSDMLIGQNKADTLNGNGNSDTLLGNKGDDTLKGGGGHDYLFGGKGNDLLIGGKSSDTFFFTTALNARHNVDTIGDFKPGTDIIGLDKGIFTALGNKVGSGEFVVAGHAQDGNDYLVFNAGKGKLFYDHDGAGGDPQVLFARIDKHLNLTHHDFAVYA